jgi:hypothetical protein
MMMGNYPPARLAGGEGRQQEPPTPGPMVLDKAASHAVSAEEAYQLITPNSLARRPLPAYPDDVRKALERSIKSSGALKFMMIWGGFKETDDPARAGAADERDEAALSRLGDVFHKLSMKAGRPADATLLFTNVHAIINGRRFSDTQAYLSGEGTQSLRGIDDMARLRGFKVIPLNQLYLRSFWGGREGMYEAIMGDGERSGIEDFNRFVEFCRNPQDHPAAERLLRSAAAHSVFARADGGSRAPEAAGTYYAWRRFEAKLLSARFDDTVFISFSDPRASEIQPNASVYWWAQKPGDGSVPWFAKRTA